MKFVVTGSAERSRMICASARIAVQQFVRGETGEVQLLGRVAERLVCRSPGRENLVPVVVVLAPERRSPGVVQFVEGPVPALQPRPERRRGDIAVAAPVVVAVFVVDVPHRQCWMSAVPLARSPSSGRRPACDSRSRKGRSPVAHRNSAAHHSTSTSSDCGCRCENHGGGVADAFARSTAMPPSCSRSMIRSSQPNSY